MVRWLSGKVIKWSIAYELSSLCQSRVKNTNFSRIKTARGREGHACGAPLQRWDRMLFVRPSGGGCR